MELGLNGKVVLVTGGSKGIGLACAKAFAEEGALLALCARSQQTLDQAAAALPGSIAVAADLTDADAALAMIDQVEARLGPIEIAVNSAGAAQRTAPPDLTPTVWRAAFDAKFFSYINVIDPLVKRMAQHGAGVMINIIGAGGKVASPNHLAGGSANAALMLATAGLGAVYAAQGVRVLAVSPGLTETDRVEQGFQTEMRASGISLEEARRRAVLSVPMGRMATPQEVANVVVFLASQKASYVTASSITMDGAQFPTVV
jgi:NAD(P)-dependent dehydrogenase (short-subunit alcohol dehydrogenase family)